MENIVEKIRKLLRLARDKAGATEAEAAAAMGMAQKLMMKYNIDNVEEKIEELAVHGDYQEMAMDKTWQRIVAGAVAELYTCRVVFYGGRVKGRTSVQFIGKPSNVLVCADTLVWVLDQVGSLHKEALKTFSAELGGNLSKFHYRNFRNSFKNACALRIAHRVNEIVAKARNEIPAHMALVVIDQTLAAADDMLKAMGTKQSRAVSINRGLGTGAGRAAGNMVKLHQQVQS